jgi:undecaprenyl-phosphate 4-deoxy-4-formamido-L-arabinose transferase
MPARVRRPAATPWRPQRTMTSLQLSVVVPVFNEEASLPELIRRTLDSCRAASHDFELVLVDDGSRDRSPSLIREAADVEPEVVGVLLNRNYGQHAAVMAGLSATRGEIVVTLDADLQNPPEEIARLVEKMGEGHDVVGSVRVPREDSMFRRAASAITNAVAQRATGVLMRDYGCMLRAYRRPVVDAMLQCGERSTFIPVLANSFASNPAEIEVSHAGRSRGQSKYNLARLVTLQFDLLTSMTRFPLQSLTIGGFVLASAGFLFGTVLIVARLLLGAAWAADGVFTLFALLFFLIGAQFFGLGLLGEYVGRIYDDVRARPRYFVREVVGREAEATAVGASGSLGGRP